MFQVLQVRRCCQFGPASIAQLRPAKVQLLQNYGTLGARTRLLHQPSDSSRPLVRSRVLSCSYNSLSSFFSDGDLTGKQFCFFDLECVHSTDSPHLPILIVAIRCCEYCIDNADLDSETWCCGRTRLRKFTRIPNPSKSSHTCLEDFVRWACFDKANKNMICFSHFGSGYDSILVFAELVRQGHKPTKVLSRGCKLLSFTAGFNVTFRDSYLFFRCSLAKLPGMFGVEASKDFFPMRWLAEGDRFIHYVGPIPPAEAFEPGRMDPKRRADFERFYRKEERSKVPFRFYKKLLEYCVMDCVCLWQTCAKFREMVLEKCDVDPLKHAVTLASLTSVIYR